MKCKYVNEIKSKVNNNNNSNNNNNHRNINNNIVTNNTNYNSSNNNNNNNNINTRTKRQTSTPTETNSNISKSSTTDSDFNIITKLVNGLSTTTSSINNNNNNKYNNPIISPVHSLSDTDVEDLNTESKQEEPLSAAAATSTAINTDTYQSDTHRSREIAVQTSIEGYELKVLTPKVKNVGTITTTASTSSSSRRPSKQLQRQRRRPTVFRFIDDEKTISTVSNTDDDVENQECK